MNKLGALFSLLAAFLLLNALPAFSGATGPYGAFGPSSDYNTIPGVESQHVVLSSGTGPYGFFGPSGIKDGVESSQIANKDECLLIAMNCPPEGLSSQEKIDRLNTEISKGTDVYTEDELRLLKDKLNDAYRELNM